MVGGEQAESWTRARKLSSSRADPSPAPRPDPPVRASLDDTRLPFPARMDARLRRVNKEIAGAAHSVDK
jgi:hypothetical protein